MAFLLRLMRGLASVLHRVGLQFGEPAVAVDDTGRPKLFIGDRQGVPRPLAVGQADVEGLAEALAAPVSPTAQAVGRVIPAEPTAAFAPKADQMVGKSKSAQLPTLVITRAFPAGSLAEMGPWRPTPATGPPTPDAQAKWSPMHMGHCRRAGRPIF